MYYRAIINTAYNTQSTEYYKADISKYISFSIDISLIEMSRSIYLNPAYLAHCKDQISS